MKTKIISGFRNSALTASCLLLLAGVADAKPGKDKGEKGGGKPEHSEKHKGDNKHSDVRKDEKAFGEYQQDARKAVEKDAKELAKWREKRFRDDDRTGVIRYFSDYRDKEYGLPPGLAKNLRRGKPLPPGWQKKVYDGYIIEDGWSDHYHPVEYSYFPQLEPVPDTRLYLFGNRLVRVYEPRREVIDVIEVPTIRFDR